MALDYVPMPEAVKGVIAKSWAHHRRGGPAGGLEIMGSTPRAPWLGNALADRLFAARAAALLTLALLLGILMSLLIGAWPAIERYGLSFLVRSQWDPVAGEFGGLVMIYGTLATSAIALLIAVPVSFGIALFLTELSPAWLKRPLGTAIELLAAVPSIVYGMWGLMVFGPILATCAAAAAGALRGVPYLGALVSGPPVGIGILSAGIILAIMIIPFIASVMRDVFEVTPALLKESAYGLGATTWEVVWQVVLPYTKTGVLGGIMLGLGALGETMAVTFVIGNMNQLSRCRCSRRPTASPRPWPTSLPRPARACTRPR
jgi:phosphate transport system permease protein